MCTIGNLKFTLNFKCRKFLQCLKLPKMYSKKLNALNAFFDFFDKGFALKLPFWKKFKKTMANLLNMTFSSLVNEQIIDPIKNLLYNLYISDRIVIIFQLFLIVLWGN